MDKRIKSLLILAVCIVNTVVVFGQATSADLEKIRVDKSGDFKYWNAESPTLSALKDFVQKVTDENSDTYVPVSDRIAAFDIDGTLACETAPSYMGMSLYMYRHFQDSAYTPKGEGLEIALLIRDFLDGKISPTTELNIRFHEQNQLSFAGMTQQEYCNYVKNFISTTPVSGYDNLLWETAIYWPMLEVVSYLRSNDFTVFLVSGSERDACRVMFCDITGIPPYHVLGTDIHYVMENQEGLTEEFETESYPYQPGERVERGAMHVLNTSVNKLACITRNIGKQPILSWGNSSGDYPMFHFTTFENPYPSIIFCNLCDDTERENGNPSKANKVRTICNENSWHAVSMRDEWATIYGYDVKRTVQPSTVTNATTTSHSNTDKYSLSGAKIYAPQSFDIVISDNQKWIVK